MEGFEWWDGLSCKHCGSVGKREIYCEARGKKRCEDCAAKFKVHEGDNYWCDDWCRSRPPPSKLPRGCSIQALNAADPAEIRARHLIGLKCGRDRWSRLIREQLRGLLDEPTAERITDGVETRRSPCAGSCAGSAPIWRSGRRNLPPTSAAARSAELVGVTGSAPTK